MFLSSHKPLSTSPHSFAAPVMTQHPPSHRDSAVFCATQLCYVSIEHMEHGRSSIFGTAPAFTVQHCFPKPQGSSSSSTQSDPCQTQPAPSCLGVVASSQTS